MRSGQKRSRRRISKAGSKSYHEEVDSEKSIEFGFEGEEYMSPVLYQSTVDVALVSEQAEDGAADRRRVRQACDYCRTKKCKCSGNDPCDECQKGDRHCSYTSADVGDELARSYTAKEYHALAQKCEELEWAFREYFFRTVGTLEGCPTGFSHMVSHIKATSDVSGDKPGRARSPLFLDRPGNDPKKTRIKRGTKSEMGNSYGNLKVANETSEIAAEPFMTSTETPPGPSLLPPQSPHMTLEESTHLFVGEPLAQADLGSVGMGYNPGAIVTPIIPGQFFHPIETTYPTNVRQSQLFGDQYSLSQSFNHSLDIPSYPYGTWHTPSSQPQHIDNRYSTGRALENQTYTEDFYSEDCARNPGDGDQ